MSHQNQLAVKHPRPVVLLLGCGHWNNPNLDVVNVQHDDMLASKRQSEIQECIDNLKRFQPTKLAVEVEAEQSHDLNELYRRYRSGIFPLTANERHQLGFRIAAECQHEEIYAIDWNETIGYEHGMEVVFEFAQKYQPELYEQLMVDDQRHLEEAQKRLGQTTVREQLLKINDPTNLAHHHQIYLTMARVGEGKQYTGIGWVQGWYARNLRIFVNLTRIVTSPQDRVLVIYGAGHIPLLNQYIRDSGLYELESVERHL